MIGKLAFDALNLAEQAEADVLRDQCDQRINRFRARVGLLEEFEGLTELRAGEVRHRLPVSERLGDIEWQRFTARRVLSEVRVQ